MRFKCNFNSCQGAISTFESINSFNSAQTSGIVNIQNDIDNGALGQKHYFCPSCKSKLIWDKMNEVSGLNGAVATFTIIADDSETPVTVPDQDGVSNGGIVVAPKGPEQVEPRFQYTKTEWKSTRETEEQKQLISWESNGDIFYGTKATNNIEEGIAQAHKRLDFKEIQTLKMAEFLKKLRMNEAVKIAMFGDSVFWGYCSVESEDRTPCTEQPTIDDYGAKFNYEGYYQNNTRIPETMVAALNTVYDNKVTLVKKIWTGDVAALFEYESSGKKKRLGAPTHWKPSLSDVAIMNYGINDAMGGHINIGYKGHIDLFVKGYKELIERELLNGTAVILLTPFKQATIGREGVHGDLDDRTLIDIYEQAIYDIAGEYGIPVINANDLTRDLTNESFIDFTHFTGAYNEAVGKRLASIFIGQSPKNPLLVTNNSYLGVRHQIDNVNLVGGACFEYKAESPNQATGIATPDLDSPTITRNPGGIQVSLKAEADKVVWSFYAEQDGMVVIPSFFTDDSAATVEVKLNFGGKQGMYPNYYNYVGSGSINRKYEEPTTVSYTSENLVSGAMGYHVLTPDTKVLKIAAAGHHSIEISVKGLTPGSLIHVYGLTFLSMQSYNMEKKIKQLEALQRIK